MPEIIIVSDAVESTNVDLDGASRHKQVEARREREGPVEENQKKAGLRKRSKEF